MYDVALLFERQLIALDIDQVLALHEGVDDTVVYHLLLPIQDSGIALSASMSAFAGGQFVPMEDPEVLNVVESELRHLGREELDASAALFTEKGATVTTSLTELDPVDALAELVSRRACREVIIMTEPHVVREFLRLDWASRARRKLEVPTLHLLEHYTFEQQAEL